LHYSRSPHCCTASHADGYPSFLSVTGNKKWSMPRAQEYREMLLILLQTALFFARLKFEREFSSMYEAFFTVINHVRG